MHMTPEEIERMSIWQFNAAVVGWASQFGESGKMSKSEEDELWGWLQSKDDVALSSGRFTQPNGGRH